MLEAARPHLGIEFDRIISVAEAGSFKPHVATYRTAAELLGAPPDAILFVANHAFDCVGAKAYGMRTCFVDRRKRPFGDWPYQPDLVVADFAELAKSWLSSGVSQQSSGSARRNHDDNWCCGRVTAPLPSSLIHRSL